MLVVRKEGKAHAQYNSFRSAFELLEAVGREPHDGFQDLQEGIPTVQQQMQQQAQQQAQEVAADAVASVLHQAIDNVVESAENKGEE